MYLQVWQSFLETFAFSTESNWKQINPTATLKALKSVNTYSIYVTVNGEGKLFCFCEVSVDSMHLWLMLETVVSKQQGKKRKKKETHNNHNTSHSHDALPPARVAITGAVLEITNMLRYKSLINWD